MLLVLLGLLAAVVTAAADAVPDKSAVMESAITNNGLTQAAGFNPKEMTGKVNAVVTEMPSVVQEETSRTRAAGRSVDVFPQERYDGHVVFSVKTTSEAQVDDLQELFKSGEIDVWKGPTLEAEGSAHFRVSPTEFNWTTSYLRRKNLTHEIIVDNVQRIIDEQTTSIASRQSSVYGWENYYRLDSIYEWMVNLVKRFSNVATLVDGGMSSEGRHVLGVRIAFGKNLPIIYMDGGIHAREWVSPAASTYIMEQLLSSQDPTVSKVARAFEWHIFPVVNPDGYEYSHTTDRLWRRSRRQTTFRCFGVDLNRNFRSQWGSTGVSWNYCSDVFPGTRSESEVETRSRVRYIETLLPRMKAFLSLHSYGQYLIYPWGFTRDHAPNWRQLDQVGLKAASSFLARHSKPLRVGNLASTLYPAAGSSMDWIYSRGVPFAYTLELRDQGQFGFLLPRDQILPAAEEALSAISALAEGVLEEVQRV